MIYLVPGWKKKVSDLGMCKCWILVQGGFNASKPREAYVRLWTVLSLAQAMDGSLIGVKPLPETMSQC